MRSAAASRERSQDSQEREPRGPVAVAPVAAARALARGDVAAARRLQRTIGNRAVGRLLARDPDDNPLPTGPELPKMPEVTGCKLIWTDGKLKWKCEGLPGIGSTPEIPLDPRKIPDEIKDKLKLPGGDKKPPLGPLPTWPQPGPGGPTIPDWWIRDACLRDPKSLLCQLTKPPLQPPGGGGSTPPPAPDRPVGTFWSYDVAFDHNLPGAAAAAPRTGVTSAGAAALDSAIFWLQMDPTLQVRLVGHASSEGSDADNLALSRRRAKAVQADLEAQGLGARVMDLVGGADPEGCERVEFGVWACGESKAAQGEARAGDRKVVMTLLRNAPVSLPLPPLRAP